MQVFNALVNLQGSPINQVHKRGLSVPEVAILRKLHGGESVARLEHAGYVEDMDDDAERERLRYEYDEGLSNLGAEEKTSVERMFGEYAPLPTELRGFSGPYNEAVEDDIFEFKKPEPFESPNAEDRFTQIRNQSKARALAKKRDSANLAADKKDKAKPAPAADKVPTGKNTAALNAVL